MNTLPQYRKGDPARFDFRVPDGLGHFVWPDPDDPELKVEFYDADGTLRFMATLNSSPALTEGDDYDETLNPEGGKFMAVEGMDLSAFALGAAEAWVYAKVDQVSVRPYPSVLAAFEVLAGTAAGPLYTTAELVREEVPGSWPEAITDEKILLAIADASRQIDAALATCYATPFPDIGDEPATPALLETICRKLAAIQCQKWMGRLNAADEQELNLAARAELENLIPGEEGAPRLRLPEYFGPVAVYQGEIFRGDEQNADERA